MADKVQGPKMAGFPSRMENCGKIVQAPAYGNIMPSDSASYMSKSQADYMHDAKKISGHMSKNKQV